MIVMVAVTLNLINKTCLISNIPKLKNGSDLYLDN